jgi:hypothetical protein
MALQSKSSELALNVVKGEIHNVLSIMRLNR